MLLHQRFIIHTHTHTHTPAVAVIPRHFQRCPSQVVMQKDVTVSNTLPASPCVIVHLRACVWLWLCLSLCAPASGCRCIQGEAQACEASASATKGVSGPQPSHQVCRAPARQCANACVCASMCERLEVCCLQIGTENGTCGRMRHNHACLLSCCVLTICSHRVLHHVVLLLSAVVPSGDFTTRYVPLWCGCAMIHRAHTHTHTRFPSLPSICLPS